MKNIIYIFLTIALVLNLGVLFSDESGLEYLNGAMAIWLFIVMFKKEIHDHFHDYWIQVITSTWGLRKEHIDQKKKEINMGLYKLHAMFFRDKHKVAGIMLEQFYGYKFYEEKYHWTFDVPNSTKKTWENAQQIRFHKRHGQESLMEKDIYLN